MQVEENLSVEKYLKAIATMTNTIGKLDVLKLHLKGMYDDKMSVAIIESIIKDLSGAVGIDYKMIDVNIPKIINTKTPEREQKNKKLAQQFFIFIIYVFYLFYQKNFNYY